MQSSETLAKYVKSLQGFLTCDVCSGPISKPKLIEPCNHSFCLSCIKNSETFTCTICNTQNQKRAEDLKDDSFKLTLQTVLQRLQDELSQKDLPDCAECLFDTYNVPSVGFCANCHAFMCQEHIDAHKKLMATRSHAITTGRPSLDPALTVPIPKCETHPGQDKVIFCATCKVLECKDCSIIGHKSHDLNFISDAAKRVQKEISMALGKAHVHKDTLVVEEEKIGSTLKQIDGETAESVAKIEREFERVVQMAVERKETLLREVSQTRTQKEAAVRPIQKKVAHALTQLQALQTIVNHIFPKMTDHEFFSAQRTVQQAFTDELGITTSIALAQLSAGLPEPVIRIETDMGPITREIESLGKLITGEKKDAE